MERENHKPRLHRLERLFVDHPVYFVTMCVECRRKALDNEVVHRAVLAFGEQGVALGCHLGRYVLMPDHIHAFVAFGVPDTSTTPALSGWVKAIKGCVSKTWREGGLNGIRWQKGFFDHVLRSSESYSEKWQYVVHNPVRAGLVARHEDWPYQGEICRLEGPRL
jgi:putative transposase